MNNLEYYVQAGLIYLIVLAVVVFILLLMVFSILSAVRRIEQKVNYLLGDNLDDFEKNRKAYKIYR